MAFQAPFEISQTSLLKLRLSSVDTRESRGAIFPFFDAAGTVRFLVVRASGAGAGAGAEAPQEAHFVASDFPLEIRGGKAIYPRPVLKYRPLADLDPAALDGLFHFDPEGRLASDPACPEPLRAALQTSNMALRSRGEEKVRDAFFTLDLRRLTGAASRSGLFSRHRLELAGLKAFLRESS